mgnify:CR=1 FL=1
MYKLGEKVQILNYLSTGKLYDRHFEFTEDMKQYSGNYVTIQAVNESHLGMTYNIQEDNRQYEWSESMLKGAEEDKQMTIDDMEEGKFAYKRRDGFVNIWSEDDCDEYDNDLIYRDDDGDPDEDYDIVEVYELKSVWKRPEEVITIEKVMKNLVKEWDSLSKDSKKLISNLIAGKPIK